MSTDSVVDFVEYRKSRVIIKDLKLIIGFLPAVVEVLTLFKRYTAVKDLLTQLGHSKRLLEIHLKHYESKGIPTNVNIPRR